MNFQAREFAAAWWSWVDIREKDNLIEKQVISSGFFSYKRSYGFFKTWPQILSISSHHWSSLWSFPLNLSGSLWTEYSSSFGHLTPPGGSTGKEAEAQEHALFWFRVLECSQSRHQLCEWKRLQDHPRPSRLFTVTTWQRPSKNCQSPVNFHSWLQSWQDLSKLQDGLSS